ncbi:MAG: nitroreductase family protein [Muribaculaceae bacterium]|nr:nitroreductase family protein [Muribaculaceae bacterium]
MTACAESKVEKEECKNTDACAAVIENIMTRTSIRQFTDQPIAKDTLDLLVKAGMAAPSAMNAQPWAFIIVTEKEVLDSLNVIKPWFNLKTATAAIIVCGNMDKTGEGVGKEYWVQDCSAATENILLAAHAYGLGAVWCGVYPNPEIVPGVCRVLEIPENIIPLNVVTLGYPAENPEPKDKFKTENIHYQKW